MQPEGNKRKQFLLIDDDADREHATLTYRGRAVEIDIPTLVAPSWFPSPRANSRA